MNENIHTLPVDDIHEHIEEGWICPCKPKVKLVNKTYLIVRNSYDGREKDETKDGE
jgi:hypothetical protein